MAAGPPGRVLCTPGKEERRVQLDEMGMWHSWQGQCKFFFILLLVGGVVPLSLPLFSFRLTLDERHG